MRPILGDLLSSTLFLVTRGGRRREALLARITADEATTLLRAVTVLSATASQLGCERPARDLRQRPSDSVTPRLAPFTEMRKGGLGRALPQWLAQHGWYASRTVTPSRTPMAGLHQFRQMAAISFRCALTPRRSGSTPRPAIRHKRSPCQRHRRRHVPLVVSVGAKAVGGPILHRVSQRLRAYDLGLR
jgi:hypothetical protein